MEKCHRGEEVQMAEMKEQLGFTGRNVEMTQKRDEFHRSLKESTGDFLESRGQQHLCNCTVAAQKTGII